MHDDVLRTAQEMLRLGLTAGTSGNVSGRDDDGRVVITPAGLPYATMTVEDLVVLDLDGRVVAGTRAPSSEYALHLACYRAYPELGGVVHAHPLYATMFACARRSIPAAVDEVAPYVGGNVPCAAYAPSGTPEIGANVVAVLAERKAALLASHGLVAVGASPAAALRVAEVVERAAHVVWGARALGGAVPLA